MLSQPSIVPRRQRIKDLILAIVLIAAGVVFFRIAGTLASNQPVVYADIVEHFKYGSIGSEPGGIAAAADWRRAAAVLGVQVAAVDVQRASLPSGYLDFGFITEPGHDLPIGVSRRRRFGVDQVGLNCARLPHRHRARHANRAARIVLGMPAQQLDLQALVQFVLECSLDARLTAEHIRATARHGTAPSLFERILLEFGLVDRLKVQTLNLRNRMQPSLGDTVPDWGRGRVDTFNPYKSVQFNWTSRKLPPSELIGASDYPSMWNQKPREGMHLHWDGDNDSVDERNLSAALGAGVTPVTVDHATTQARSRLDLDAAAAGVPVSGRPRRWPRAARRSTSSTARTATPTRDSVTA